VARGKKSNPIDDIGKIVGGWLGGGARALDAAVNVGRSPGTNTQTAKAAEAVYNVLDTATNNGVTAIRNGPDAFQSYAQQQMLLMGLGIAAEPVAMAGGRALAKTGVAARIANRVTGKTVMVHGTPNKIVGDSLLPKYGSNAAPGESALFGWNPRSKNAKTTLAENAARYSEMSGRGPIEGIVPERNVVVAKVKTSKTNLGQPGSSPDFVRSSDPAKIVSVVKAPGSPGVTYESYIKELNKALRKAGSPIRGENPVGRLGDRVERIRRQLKYKLSDRNGVS